MNAEELEKIVASHGMQYLELKESFNVECVVTAGAFSLCGGRISPANARWTSRRGDGMV